MKSRRQPRWHGLVKLLLLLVIVSIIGLTGRYVWQTSREANQTLDTANRSATGSRSQAASIVFRPIPESWTEYKNSKDGLRLGFPGEWGELDSTTLTTPNFRDNAANLQGRFSIAISKKEGFSVVAHKYGATIKPSQDGQSWIVSEENPAAADSYTKGDTYKTHEIKVIGGTAIDLSYVDEDCTQTRWLLELKNSYALVTIPSLCASVTNAKSAAVSDANKTSYKQLTTDFLSYITIY